MIEVALRNRQRARPVNTAALRRLTRILLRDLLGLEVCAVGIHLVDRPTIESLNRRYLNHAGPTDVITLDYGEAVDRQHLCGEIFICVEIAAAHAALYHTRWPNELVRCLVHALLHLQGFDDRHPRDRRRMKRRENRLLVTLARRGDFGRIARRP